MEKAASFSPQKQNIINRFLGCWHLKMSRPTTKNEVTYQYCLKCGMRRNYDLETFRASGSFYSAPISDDIYYV